MGKSKKIKFICFFTALILLALFSVSLYSCKTDKESAEEKAWNELKNTGSLEDLLSFAGSLEAGGLLDEVNVKINEKINAEEDTVQLFFLLNKYPERETEFKERIAKTLLDYAIKDNKPESLERYIADYSDYSKNPKYIEEAKNALKNMYFNAAEEKKSIELLEEFISRYEREDADMAERAAGIIDDINWENTQKGGSRSDYAGYIENNGRSQKYIGEAKKKIDEFDWNETLEKLKFQNNILTLKEFSDSHPDSAFISEAGNLIEQMQNDPSYSEKCLSEPDLDSIDEFIKNFPGHKDIAAALELRKDFTGDIFSLAAKGYIDNDARGDSVTRTSLYVENLTTSKIIVTVPFGMFFAADNGYTQNMLVREEKTFTVDPGKVRGIYINTACLNIYKDSPDERSVFRVSRLEESSPLIPLLKVMAENKSIYEVAQAAIWQLTDNPGKDIILDTLEYQDGTPAIREEDYAEALRLIELAEK